MRPGHGEPLLDVGLDLGAEAQHEPSLGDGLEVVGHHGQRHRVAGEGDGDAGAQLQPLGVLGGQHQGEEGVVACLGRPDAVVPDLLRLLRGLDHAARIEPDCPVDVHGPRYPGHQGQRTWGDGLDRSLHGHTR
jgi:hypothetical protein